MEQKKSTEKKEPFQVVSSKEEKSFPFISSKEKELSKRLTDLLYSYSKVLEDHKMQVKALKLSHETQVTSLKNSFLEIYDIIFQIWKKEKSILLKNILELIEKELKIQDLYLIKVQENDDFNSSIHEVVKVQKVGKEKKTIVEIVKEGFKNSKNQIFRFTKVIVK